MRFRLLTIPLLISLAFSGRAFAAVNCQELGSAGSTTIGATDCAPMSTPGYVTWVTGNVTNTSGSAVPELDTNNGYPAQTTPLGSLTNNGDIGVGSVQGLFINSNTIVADWSPTPPTLSASGISEILNGSGATISGSNYGVWINTWWNVSGSPQQPTVNQINNAGTISSSGGDAIYINGGYVHEILNSNVLSSASTGSGIKLLNEVSPNDYRFGVYDPISGNYVNSNSKVDFITNTAAGVIRDGAYGINNIGGTIGTIDNAGSISGATRAISNTVGISAGIIDTIINSGTISSSDTAIYNNGGSSSAAVQTISTITNNANGTITGANFGIYNTYATIGTITNFGNVSGSSVGIYNYLSGTITRLNNAQSGLTYAGTLPTYYNIIITGSGYGTLNGTGQSSGSTMFGVSSLSTLRAGTFAGVLTGGFSTSAGLSNTGASSGRVTGTVSNYNWTLTYNTSTSAWDLLLAQLATGPNAANTLQSVQSNVGGLASLYNQQTAAYQAALSYDCSVYDENNLCVSVGGRYTYASPSATNAQAGLVIVGYRPMPTFRIGAFADQSVNISTPTNLSQSKSSPMWGMFARWNLNKDGTGLGVQASAVTSSSTLTVNRAQLTDTEAGSGKTQFDGQGYQLSTSYHQPVTDATALVPYIGLRYTRVNAGAYTESSSATVTAPLSYNAMAQNNFSAIGGVGVRSLLAEKLTGTASVGIQQSVKYSMANYQGTSAISGLENFSVQMPGANNSMATATAGLAYDINKRERLGFNVLWQQQPFINTNTTTALATYTMGF